MEEEEEEEPLLTLLDNWRIFAFYHHCVEELLSRRVSIYLVSSLQDVGSKAKWPLMTHINSGSLKHVTVGASDLKWLCLGLCRPVHGHVHGHVQHTHTFTSPWIHIDSSSEPSTRMDQTEILFRSWWSEQQSESLIIDHWSGFGESHRFPSSTGPSCVAQSWQTVSHRVNAAKC